MFIVCGWKIKKKKTEQDYWVESVARKDVEVVFVFISILNYRNYIPV